MTAKRRTGKLTVDADNLTHDCDDSSATRQWTAVGLAKRKTGEKRGGRERLVGRVASLEGWRRGRGEVEGEDGRRKVYGSLCLGSGDQKKIVAPCLDQTVGLQGSDLFGRWRWRLQDQQAW